MFDPNQIIVTAAVLTQAVMQKVDVPASSLPVDPEFGSDAGSKLAIMTWQVFKNFCSNLVKQLANPVPFPGLGDLAKPNPALDTLSKAITPDLVQQALKLIPTLAGSAAKPLTDILTGPPK